MIGRASIQMRGYGHCHRGRRGDSGRHGAPCARRLPFKISRRPSAHAGWLRLPPTLEPKRAMMQPKVGDGGCAEIPLQSYVFPRGRARDVRDGGCGQVAGAALSSPAGNLCLRSSAQPPFTTDW
jgi:hypothetical protein